MNNKITPFNAIQCHSPIYLHPVLLAALLIHCTPGVRYKWQYNEIFRKYRYKTCIIMNKWRTFTWKIGRRMISAVLCIWIIPFLNPAIVYQPCGALYLKRPDEIFRHGHHWLLIQLVHRIRTSKTASLRCFPPFCQLLSCQGVFLKNSISLEGIEPIMEW